MLSAEASDLLVKYAWPGNVRELQNLMERALILCEGAQIRGVDLIFESGDLSSAAMPSAPEVPVGDEESGLRSNLRSMEEQLVIDALQQSRGSRQAAASILGVSPRTLRYKVAMLRDAGVDIPGL